MGPTYVVFTGTAWQCFNSSAQTYDLGATIIHDLYMGKLRHRKDNLPDVTR